MLLNVLNHFKVFKPCKGGGLRYCTLHGIKREFHGTFRGQKNVCLNTFWKPELKMITLLTENVLKNILKLAVGEDCYQRMHLSPFQAGAPHMARKLVRSFGSKVYIYLLYK